jgi:hypothetical protein
VSVDAPFGEPFGDAAALCSCTALPLTITDTSIEGNRLTVHVRSGDDNGPSGPPALDSGGPTTILRTIIARNHATVTAESGGAGTLGTIGFFSGGTDPVTIAESAVYANRVAAIAPSGTATVQGAAITNAGALVLDHAAIRGNHGTASGVSGSAQGAGIWNGEIFGIPTSPPTLRHTQVTGNTLTASPGLDVLGGGLYTIGFPPRLTDSRLADNLPDQCAGC